MIFPRELGKVEEKDAAVILAGDFNSLPHMEPYILARSAIGKYNSFSSVVKYAHVIQQPGWSIGSPIKRIGDKGLCRSWRWGWTADRLPCQRIPTGTLVQINIKFVR